MGKNKDAAVGFIIIGIIIAIIAGVVMVLLPGETQEKESETYKPDTIGGIPIEPGVSYKVSESGAVERVNDGKLTDQELQTVIAGFESYNESVKMLLDMCANVESEADFRQLGLLVAEHGEKFLENTAGYGTARDTLMSEGYGEHPVLGPLLDQSEILIGGMSSCMEVLAWEFGG